MKAHPANPDKTINLALTAGKPKITLASGLNVPEGTIINGACTSPANKPAIEIDVNGSNSDIILNGKTSLYGLSIKLPSTSQVRAINGGNKLKCVALSNK